MKPTAHLPSRCPGTLRPVAFAVVLSLLADGASAKAAPHAPDARRVAQAVASARAAVGTELVARTALVNKRNTTVVHAMQTVQGHRVWGSEAVVHAQANGRTRIASSSIGNAAQPAKSATLTQDQAVAIARKALGLQGRAFPPKTELVVFPTKYRGDIKFAWNAQAGQYRLDRANSVIGAAPTDANVWAWEVELFAHNNVDGVRDMKYVVDARTGAILRVDTCLQTLAPANPPLLDASDVPVLGSGNSQYSGTVPLSTTQRADGTYMLIDQTRGSAWNPWLHDFFWDADGNPIYGPDGNPISVIGLQTMTETHEGDMNDFTWAANYHWYDQNPTNAWGDGTQFAMYPYGGETSANGQTAAVDAHWGMAVTWDFYRNVFGRNGVDDLGTSLVSEVHVVGPFGAYYDNAFWNTYTMGMFYSDGTRNVGVDPNTGGPTTPDPSGSNSLTAIDIIGHEMTHGVTAFSSGLVYDGEAGAINESTSDFMGSMVEAYSTRPAGADSTVPETGTDWLMGAKISDKPLRSMINPSVDGMSPNWWYSGIEYLDVHYSSGPLNRFFYFLSQGAPSDAGSPAYSTYLPGGMSGVGNDKAARIWYTAMTEWLTPVAKYADAPRRRHQRRHRALRRRLRRSAGREERVRGHQRGRRGRRAARGHPLRGRAARRLAVQFGHRRHPGARAHRRDGHHGAPERGRHQRRRHERHLEERRHAGRPGQPRLPRGRRRRRLGGRVDARQPRGLPFDDGGEQRRPAGVRRGRDLGGQRRRRRGQRVRRHRPRRRRAVVGPRPVRQPEPRDRPGRLGRQLRRGRHLPSLQERLRRHLTRNPHHEHQAPHLALRRHAAGRLRRRRLHADEHACRAARAAAAADRQAHHAELRRPDQLGLAPRQGRIVDAHAPGAGPRRPAGTQTRGVGFNLKRGMGLAFTTFPNGGYALDTGVFQLKGTNTNFEAYAGTDADPVLFASAPLKSGDVLSTGIFQKDRTNSPKDSAAPLVQVAVTLADFAKVTVDTVNASTDPYGLHVVKARIVPADIGGMNFVLTTDVIKKAKMIDVAVDVGVITATP